MIWGISSPKKEVSFELEDVECPKCGDVGESYLYGYARYIHIFWIPMFSIGKRVRMVCTSCEKQTKYKQMPSNVQNAVPQFKKLIKIPFTHFVGAILVVLFIFFMVYILRTGNDEDNELLAAPEVGDVYKIHDWKSEDALYTSWKVITKNEDSVFIQVNEVKFEDSWTLFVNLDKEENQRYNGDTIAYSLNDLLELKAENVITDVLREE